VNGRLVRVSGVVVAPALLALLFSISTPGTLARPQVDPLFDASSASIVANQLSSDFPARVPGSGEGLAAAQWYEQTVEAAGIRAETDSWNERLADLGEVELRNVVAVVPGRSAETILVVARRDNGGGDGRAGDNASGTAALIELARSFAPQGTIAAPVPQRTLVLVSTDAGAYGGAGAARFARTSPYAEQALVAIVLDGIGGGGQPRIAIAGDRPGSPSRALVSTALASIADQVGQAPELPSIPEQLVGLAIPLGVGEQGPFLARGVAAVTLTTRESGEPSVPVGDPEGPLALERLGDLGRAAEAVVTSVDQSVGAAFRTPDSVFFADRVASGWAVRLTLIVLVVPFALGVVDLVARARRRGLAFRPAMRGLRARLLLWSFGAVLLWLGALVGILPTGAALALPTYSESVDDRPTAGVLLLLGVLAAAWSVARRPLTPSASVSPADRLAGYAVGLAWLGLVAVVAAIGKPYVLVLVLPSLYAWLWLPVQTWPPATVALYGLGLAGPFLGIAVLGNQLGLGPLDTAFYVASLVTVGYVSVPTVLLAVAWAAAAAQLGALALGRYGAYARGVEPPPPGLIRGAVGAIARGARRRRYARAT
jgi:Zn-dependent M28 family amino/carboxypeptidase